jgi:hypothetical protein
MLYIAALLAASWLHENEACMVKRLRLVLLLSALREYDIGELMNHLAIDRMTNALFDDVAGSFAWLSLHEKEFMSKDREHIRLI